MKGAHSFTICGDPLFFAPELVNHQGYDYAADLWALGILAFVVFEEATPFGNSDTDETTIFKAISGYKSRLPFTEKTPAAAQSLVLSLLDPVPHLRAGYLMDEAVRGHAFFEGRCSDMLTFQCAVLTKQCVSLVRCQVGRAGAGEGGQVRGRAALDRPERVLRGR
jgi:serine/threonine protein kinase